MDDAGSDGHSSSGQGSAEISKGTLGISYAHSIWLWPAMGDVLKSCASNVVDPLRSLQFSEISWLMRLQKPAWEEKGFEEGLAEYPTFRSEEEPFLKPFDHWVGMTYDEIQQVSNTYFNTFNYLYPFMNRSWFFTHTLPKALEGSHLAEDETTIALLVLALGQLAHDGAWGPPISATSMKSSGVRGGTAELPPGFSLFGKARQRVAFHATEYTLESVQIFSLQG